MAVELIVFDHESGDTTPQIDEIYTDEQEARTIAEMILTDACEDASAPCYWMQPSGYVKHFEANCLFAQAGARMLAGTSNHENVDGFEVTLTPAD